MTSHRSQGLSRERVYVTVDTRHSEELVNRRQFYVSVSRAVQDARIYTDDRMALARAVSREQERESALSIAESTQAMAPPTTTTATRSHAPSALDIAENSERSRDPLDVALARTARPPRSAPKPEAFEHIFAQAMARLAGLDPPKIPLFDRATRDR